MKADRAFTLIEILLVVIIIGIVLALSAPNFSKGYARFELNKTADDIMSISRWAQAMAIGQERPYALFFGSDHRSYTLERAKSQEEDGPESFEPLPGSLGRKHLLPAAVELDIGAERLEFYSDGTIDPAVIQLACPQEKIVLSTKQVRGMMTKGDQENE